MTDEWKWGNQGVDIRGDHLLWYENLGPVAFASGAASEQTFEDFLAHGPSVGLVPDDIVQAIRERLREA